MIWGMPMLPDTYRPSTSLSNTSGSCYGLTQEAAGAFNSNWTKVAEAMVANGFGSSIVRPGWEFNGNWMPWAAGGCASAYVGAYQQMVTSMRAVWEPTSPSSGTRPWDTGVGNLSSFYPGNAYVNYIGSDVYDLGGPTYSGAQAEFTNMETESYGLNWLASFAAQQGKQIVLPEWGLGWGACNAGQPINASNGGETCGGDNPTFINDMSSWIKGHNVFEANFWDYGSSTMAGCPSACTPIGSNQGDNNAIPGGNINSFRALVADFGFGLRIVYHVHVDRQHDHDLPEQHDHDDSTPDDDDNNDNQPAQWRQRHPCQPEQRARDPWDDGHHYGERILWRDRCRFRIDSRQHRIGVRHLHHRHCAGVGCRDGQCDRDGLPRQEPGDDDRSVHLHLPETGRDLHDAHSRRGRDGRDHHGQWIYRSDRGQLRVNGRIVLGGFEQLPYGDRTQRNADVGGRRHRHRARRIFQRGRGRQVHVRARRHLGQPGVREPPRWDDHHHQGSRPGRSECRVVRWRPGDVRHHGQYGWHTDHGFGPCPRGRHGRRDRHRGSQHDDDHSSDQFTYF